MSRKFLHAILRAFYGQLQSFSNPDLIKMIATIIAVVAGTPTTLETRGATA